MKKIILYSWMLPLTVFGATSSVVETIAEAEGITLNAGWRDEYPDDYEKKTGLNLNGSVVSGYSIEQITPEDNYIEIFDENGYSVAIAYIIQSNRIYTLLSYSWHARYRLHSHFGALNPDDAEIKKADGSYYL